MVNVDLNSIERRIPVLDSETVKNINFPNIKKQWNSLTEVIRREILVNPILRNQVLKYIGFNLKEGLPIEFLNDLSDNEKIKILINNYKNEVIKYLELDEVSDKLINVDLKYSTKLVTPEKIYDLYNGDEDILNEYIEDGTFKKGITEEESALVASRYAMARDVKLLALIAELTQNKNINSRDSKIVLDSGVIIYKNNDTDLSLLDSNLWQNRKQIEDRVYEINIGNKKYILKERKTARHINTFETKTGHKDGLTSQEEFEIANFFKKNCMVQDGEVMVNWESPVFSVLFPDGYQVTVFEYEKGLIEDNVKDIVFSFIHNHKELFEKEYEFIKANTDKYIGDKRIIRQLEDGFVSSFLKKIGLLKEDIETFSFDNYARFKTVILIEKAEDMIFRIITSSGYMEHDGKKDYGYKIHIINGEFRLEIYGFDFEYFKKINEARQKSLLKKKKRYLGENYLRRGRTGELLTKVQQAGGLILEDISKGI